MAVFNHAEDSQIIKSLGMTMGGFVLLTVVLATLAVMIS